MWMEVLRERDGVLETARIVLEATGKASFTLISMVHVGERSFFQKVRDDLNTHDAVLMEGIRLLPRFRSRGSGAKSAVLQTAMVNSDTGPRSSKPGRPEEIVHQNAIIRFSCLLYTSPSPRDS